MRTLCLTLMFGALLVIAPVSAEEKRLIQISPAGPYTLRLATQSSDDDALTQAARRAADDPYPDASTLKLIESVRRRDQAQWEQAFSMRRYPAAYDMLGFKFRERR